MAVESSPAAKVQQLAIMEQQGVVEAGASMAVESSPVAEMQQLVVTEQQEEQPKRKPVKKEKRIRLESIWLKSPYVVPKQKRRGQDWKEGKTARRCPFHYVSRDSGIIGKFDDWLKKDDSQYNSNPFRLARMPIPKSFFTELVDANSDLSDEHIEVGIYFLRKKYCYHLPNYSKSRCAITDLLFDQYMTKLGTVHPSDDEKKKILKRREKSKSKRKRTSKEEEEVVFQELTEYTWFEDQSTGEMVTNYVRGTDLSCGISWACVEKVFFPFRLPPTGKQTSTHYFFGILIFKEKIIYVYDSLKNQPYDIAVKHVEIYARLIPHCLKCLDFGSHNKSWAENSVDKFQILWMKTPLQNNKYVFGISFNDASYVEVGASMAVESSPAAEMQQLVVTEQQEEQPKRKPVKKEKRIRVESIC